MVRVTVVDKKKKKEDEITGLTAEGIPKAFIPRPDPFKTQSDSGVQTGPRGAPPAPVVPVDGGGQEPFITDPGVAFFTDPKGDIQFSGPAAKREREVLGRTIQRQEQEIITAEQEQQESERQAGLISPGQREELASEFGAAGVFEEPEVVPIISPEQENAGVLMDMLVSLIGIDKLPSPPGGIDEDTPAFRKRLAEERVTETELAIQNLRIDKTLASEIVTTYDEEIEATMVEMGLVSLPLLAAVGAGVGGFVGSFAQLIGTDKKVKNLTTGIVKLETIATDIASTVSSGDMDTTEGFERIKQISLILDNMEAQLQLAAIDSANVRISLKGRDVAIKIFSGRSRINTSLREVAGFKIEGLIENSPAHQKAATLADLKTRFNK